MRLYGMESVSAGNLFALRQIKRGGLPKGRLSFLSQRAVHTSLFKQSSVTVDSLKNSSDYSFAC